MSPIASTFRLPVLALLTLLGSCASTGLMEPKAIDPLDGYKGSYAEVGVNTEVDWGPKQNLLLSEFTSLKEAHNKLRSRVDQLVAENANLTTRLSNEATSLEREKSLRAQSEAETELLRTRRRDLETRILNLSLEKTKLEQAYLKTKIDALNIALEQGAPPVNTPATPPSNR
ncbi:MAG: hypothetical protein FJ301_14050 [Planctomycetes bacterium]|nr:hypothetical protein [Planctomycetota bacterium]